MKFENLLFSIGPSLIDNWFDINEAGFLSPKLHLETVGHVRPRHGAGNLENHFHFFNILEQFSILKRKNSNEM
jgi:hypothetical protein